MSTPTSNGTSQAAALVSGTFALLRSAFPHASARDLVTRALYRVHNGLGTAGFGRRIGDRLGFGEILPAYALRHASDPGRSGGLSAGAVAGLNAGAAVLLGGLALLLSRPRSSGTR